MTAKIFRFVFVLALFVALSGCGNKCPTCPTPPGGNGDDGPPPGQGGASIRSVLYVGDCPRDPSGCSGEYHPTDDPALQEPGYDATYILKEKDYKQVYTLWTFVEHSQVPGRRIRTKARVYAYSNELEFGEDDPTRRSPVGMALPFNMTDPEFGFVTSTADGIVFMEERRGDTPPMTHEAFKFKFRVPGPTR